MKLTSLILTAALALFAAGSALAKDYDMNYEGHVNSLASTGRFEAEIIVKPLADGTFDDYVFFRTGTLRSISVGLSGTHGVNWGDISLTQGSTTVTSFSTGSATDRLGEHSGGDTGFFTLHLKGTVHSQDINEHNKGEYKVSVTAVPEPETYAMLLAGLGLMGAVTRRRKAKQL
jgi:hypothetical protein